MPFPPDPFGTVPVPVTDEVAGSLPIVQTTLPLSYTTELSPDEEQAFRGWVSSNKIPFDPGTRADYDMRGFWKALQNQDPRATTAVNQADGQTHFPDTWKTPYHETYSNESVYAPSDAPHWDGNVLVDKTGATVADERTPDEIAAAWPPAHWQEPVTDELPGAPVMPWERPLEAPPDLPTPFSGPGIRAMPDLVFGEDRQRAAPDPLAYAVTPGDPNAPLPSMREEQVNDPFAGLTDEQGFQLARTIASDPVAFDELRRSRQLLEDRRATAAALRAEDENIAAIKANREMRERAAAKAQADTDRIIADATELSKRGLDRKNWFTKLDTFGKIGAVIGALTGGLMSKAGGPNQGIAFIDSLIDDDINDQKYQIELARDALKTRQGAVAQAYQMSGDLYQAAEVARLATYNALIAKLKTDQQNFDPRGTMFLNHGAAIQQMQGAAAKKEIELRQQRFENEIKKGELKIKALAEERQRLKAGAGTGKPVFTPQQLGAINPGMPTPPIPMTQEAYAKWLDAQKTGEQLKGEQRRNDPHEIDVEKAVPGVVDDQGDLVRFASKEIANDISNAKENTDEIVRLTNELITMVKANGWSSSFIKSPEWRRATQNYNEILIKKKEQDKLGVITGPDLSIVTKEIGTDDPTEVRGGQVVAALEHFRHNQVEGFNAKTRNKAILPQGRKLVRWEPPVLDLPPAKGTKEDKLLDQRSTETLDDLIKREIQARTSKRGYDLDVYGNPDDQAIYQEAVAAARSKFDPNASVEQRAKIDELTAAVLAGGPAAADARKALESAAKSTTSARIKELAKSALDAIDSRGKPGPRGPQSHGIEVPPELRLDGGG